MTHRGAGGPAAQKPGIPLLPGGLSADPAPCQGDAVCCQPTSAGMEPREMLPAGHSALRCPQSRQAARDMGDLVADLCNGCSGLVHPVHPAPRAASSPLMSQELRKSFGAWGQPASASLPLHAEGTQGCLYTARPLQPRGMEKQDVTPIERRDRQVVKRTGSLCCCDCRGPSVLAPCWPVRKGQNNLGKAQGISCCLC